MKRIIRYVVVYLILHHLEEIANLAKRVFDLVNDCLRVR